MTINRNLRISSGSRIKHEEKQCIDDLKTNSE